MGVNQGNQLHAFIHTPGDKSMSTATEHGGLQNVWTGVRAAVHGGVSLLPGDYPTGETLLVTQASTSLCYLVLSVQTVAPTQISVPAPWVGTEHVCVAEGLLLHTSVRGQRRVQKTKTQKTEDILLGKKMVTFQAVFSRNFPTTLPVFTLGRYVLSLRLRRMSTTISPEPWNMAKKWSAHAAELRHAPSHCYVGTCLARYPDSRPPAAAASTDCRPGDTHAAVGIGALSVISSS